MSEPSLIGLIQNVALLTVLVLIFDTLEIHFRRDHFSLFQVLSGLLVAGIGVSVMLTPWELLPGVIFDTRSVLLCLSGLFFGTIPTLIAILITGAFRIYQGGGGALTGVLVIIATGAIGIIYRMIRRDALEKITWLELYGFGLVVHLVVLALMLTFPWKTALDVLANISLPVMIIYPLTVAFLGKWTGTRIAREKLAEDNKREKTRFEVMADNTVDLEYWLTPDNQFEYCSPSCFVLTGYTQSEFTSHPDIFHEMIDPKDLPAFEQAQRLTSSGHSDHNAQIDFRIIQKNKQTRWVSQVSKAVYNEANQCIGIRGSIRDITNQKLAEKKELESQKRLADIVEFLPDATMAIDQNRRLIIWNRAMEEMTGIPSHAMLGKGDYAYANPFYGQPRPQLIDSFWLEEQITSNLYPEMVKAGNTFTAEVFCSALYDNRGAWLYAKTSPLLDHEGNLIGAIESLRDISERKRTEEALKESLNTLNRSQSIARVGNWYLDLKDGTFSASLEGYRLFGFAPDTRPTYDEVFAQIHSEDRSRIHQILQDTISTGFPYEEEFRVFLKDTGELRYIYSIGELERNPAGHPVRVFGINQDVTDRKLAEESLRESEQNFREIYNSTSEGIFIDDAETGQMIDINDAVLKIYGYPNKEELLAGNIGDLSANEAPYTDAVAQEYIRKAITDGPQVFEWLAKRRDGSIFWAEISLCKSQIAGKSRVLAVARDISERKNSEKKIQMTQMELKRLLRESEHSRQALLSLIEDQKEAEQQIRQLNAELEQRVAERTVQLTAANHELEAFSYSVSHDLRAPLRAIQGFSIALQEEHALQLDSQGKHYLARIQESAVQMGQLINDLLNLSRVTRASFSPQQVNLSRLAESIAAELKEKTPQRLVRFTIASGMLVEGDSNLLRIALENLMNNAYKFTDQRELALISVGMQEQPHGRAFFVRDNGAGFNMEYADKLFIPFQRLHSSSEFAGTGIGLSIVHRIITRHGGHIWPEAVVGEGATFYFTLGDAKQ